MSVANPFPSSPPSGLNGKILTFYSYKGGTGRSMLLSNVAWLLASSGKKVLAIDWDLEAPGLQRYFFPFLQDKELSWSDGLINFVNDYKTQAMSPPPEGEESSPDWHLRYADIRRYAVSLQWDFPKGGRLDFVPAGKQDATYSDLVNSFNWEDFYKRLGGSRFLESAALLMRQNYEYILIDSRTGVSDTSGICTIKMPDALVVCFTLNYQSINGAAAVADFVWEQRKSQAQAITAANSSAVTATTVDRRRFNIFPIPMRLEDAQTRKLERRREYARKRKFSQYPAYFNLNAGGRDDYWSSVGVRYHTFYAYEELLAAFGEKERDANSLLSTVQRITKHLVDTDDDIDVNLPLPAPRREEILREFEGETYEASPAQQRTPVQAADDALASLTPDQLEMARRVILRLVRVAGPNEAEHTRQIVPLGDFDQASRSVLQMLQEYQIVTVRSDPAAKGDVVQIVADVPLKGWPRVQAWIEADRDFLVWRQELRAQAEKWSQNRERSTARESQTPNAGDDGSLRLSGSALSVAVTWVRSRGNDLAPIERSFIEESLAREAQEREHREAHEQGARERRVAEQLESDRQKREEQEHARRKESGLFGGLISRFARTRPPLVKIPVQSPEMIMAREVLRGRKLTASELLALAKKLKGEQAFSVARRILARALEGAGLEEAGLRLRIYQEAALCTYKDAELPADERLDMALDLLRRGEDLATTKNQETLGLTGAIYKRKWEIDSQKEQLELSLRYYLRGYQEGPAHDQGYTGINAAFVLDLIAHLETSDAATANTPSTLADVRRAEASQIREDIVFKVAPLLDQPENKWLAGAWWFFSTIAEALFGLRRYDEAISWLERGAAVGNVPEWEYRSTLEQLARLALMQTGEVHIEELQYKDAWKALTQFFRNHADAVKGAFIGKVGLALSGGGFRAALYHIGVLARLAEMDVLRQVEVLSCVSGGSIVGAHYYLEVRKLLQSKADWEITREDYLEIVKRIEADFVAGVQRNIRTRVLAEFLTNALMILNPDYSRTQRVGELYEREIFSRVADGEGHQPRWLGELNIQPLGEKETFAPKRDNWRRKAKAPILNLNATTLNTGHNWQFTTSWMGEPPGRINTDVDGNEQFRRMYYWEAPEGHQQIRLGHATAASACVPGVFEPLTLNRLYEDRVVRLVDGGVCDNQGVSGLLEQDCTVILVSDGSGQSESQHNPSRGLLGVPLRSNSILQARVRDAQYQELHARRRSSLLRGLMFIHLKKDLDVDPIDWLDCQDPYEASDDARPPSRKGPLTSYGIAKDVQTLLAGIRTDLDSFSDLEANALMTSGYRMTEHEFKSSPDLQVFLPPQQPATWGFLAVEQAMKGSGSGRRQNYLKRILAVGGASPFKVWRLSAALQALAWMIGIALAASLGWVLWRSPNLVVVPEVMVGDLRVWILGFAATSLATYFFGKTLVGLFRWRDTLSRVGIGVGMSLVGWVVARLHLHIFDRIFLMLGSMGTFQRQPERPK